MVYSSFARLAAIPQSVDVVHRLLDVAAAQALHAAEQAVREAPVLRDAHAELLIRDPEYPRGRLLFRQARIEERANLLALVEQEERDEELAEALAHGADHRFFAAGQAQRATKRFGHDARRRTRRSARPEATSPASDRARTPAS